MMVKSVDVSMSVIIPSVCCSCYVCTVYSAFFSSCGKGKGTGCVCVCVHAIKLHEVAQD